MKEISLSDLCKMYGLTRRVIQGYEKEGLVKRRGKNKYGHLMYDDDSIRKVAIIRFLQINNFSLKEISKITESKLYIKEIKKELLKCNQKHKEEMYRLKMLIEKNKRLLKISNEKQLLKTITEEIMK